MSFVTNMYISPTNFDTFSFEIKYKIKQKQELNTGFQLREAKYSI